MINKPEDDLKIRLESAMTNAINDIIKTFREEPMFYLNEEDIRCDLYSKISVDFGRYEIFLKNPYSDSFSSNAIHLDARFYEKGKKNLPFPDLLVYFSINSKNDPIPVQTNDNQNNVYFLKKSNEKHNKNRVIVEIKFTDHTGYSNKPKDVIDDLKKISEWEAWKKYVLYFDRSNKLHERAELKSIIDIMKMMTEKGEGDVEFYYFGMSVPGSKKEGQIYHFVNGILVN